MQKVISESANGSALNEGMISFDMRDLMSYVTTQSKKIQTITEQFEFSINEDMSNVDYDRMNKLVSIKEGNDTLKLFLEQSIVNDIDDFFSKF